jgi:hypothetical protein
MILSFELYFSGAGMDLLVVLGTSAAYFYSLLIMFTQFTSGKAYHGHDFFETSAILITTVCLGKYMEHLAKQQTTSQLSALFHLQARKTDLILLAPAELASWTAAAHAAGAAMVATHRQKELSVHRETDPQHRLLLAAPLTPVNGDRGGAATWTGSSQSGGAALVPSMDDADDDDSDAAVVRSILFSLCHFACSLKLSALSW